MTPKQKMMVALPVVAVFVMVLVYFGLFANPLVIAAIFVLYVVVSLWNRRKFNRQRERAGQSTPQKKTS